MLLEEISEYAEKNKNKKIAMFVDMDGTIVNLDINDNIAFNKPNLFLNKKPLTTVIAMLQKVSKISNIEMYILSACAYQNQAEDKKEWLKKNAPFFKEENQIFVIKEIANYTNETKAEIKTNNIINVLENKNYDLAIYFEDEYKLLKKSARKLKDKIYCIHISNFID